MIHFIQQYRGPVIFVSLVLIGIIASWLLENTGECPREMANWPCRGSSCDHSPEAIARAKREARRYK